MDARASSANCSFSPSEGRQKGGSLHYSRGEAEGSLYGDNVTGGGVSAPPVGPSQLLRCNRTRLLSLLKATSASLKLFLVLGKEGQRTTERGQRRVTEGVKGEVCVCVCVVHAFRFVSIFVRAIHRRVQSKTCTCSFSCARFRLTSNPPPSPPCVWIRKLHSRFILYSGVGKLLDI